MLFFSACKDPNDTGIGVLPDEGLINGNYTDTFSLEFRTLAIDTVPTGALSQEMFGEYIDPYFGRIRAASYAQFRLTGNNLTFGDPQLVTLDSVILKLDLTGFYGRYNDPLELEIFEITEDFPADSLLTNESSLAVDNSYDYAGGAKIDFSGLGGFLDFVNIRLDDSLGRKFLLADEDSLVDNSVFTEFFKGLYIGVKPVSQLNREPGGIFYTDLLSGLTNLSVHYTDETGKSRAVAFTVTSESPRFHSISRSEYTDKLIQTIWLDSTLTVTPTYSALQSGLLNKLYVGTPTLRNFENVIVNKAELILRIDPDYLGQDGLLEPPKTVFVFVADSTGYREYDLDQINSTATYDDTHMEYRISLTNTVMDMISGRLPDAGFVIVPGSNGITVNRAVIGGPGNAAYSPSLRITYTNIPR